MGQFDCHPQQAFLRSEGSRRAARCVALFLRKNNRAFGSLPNRTEPTTNESGTAGPVIKEKNHAWAGPHNVGMFCA